MKQLKRLFLALLCVGTIMGTAACGSNNNADDNGATQDGTTNGTADDAENTNGTDDANGTNDATNGNDNANGEGVMDEIGDDVRDGADEIGDDIKDSVDDNNTNRNTDDTNK